MNKILLIVLFLILGFNFVFAAGADLTCESSNNKAYPWCEAGKEGIASLVKTFYDYALALVGVAALGAIIYGGILYTISAGNPGKITEAKEWIFGALSGVVLLISASLLFNTINSELIILKEPGMKEVKVSSTLPVAYDIGSYQITDISNNVDCLKYGEDHKDKYEGCVWNNNSKKCTCAKKLEKNVNTKEYTTTIDVKNSTECEIEAKKAGSNTFKFDNEKTNNNCKITVSM